MSNHATCTFQIDNWEEATWDDHDGIKLAKARLAKTFHGELEGHSTVEILTAQGATEAARAYVGLERIVGRLNDRSGSFVLLHAASANGISWTIVPELGTDELRGLRGSAQITIDADGGHTLTLDYELAA
jgi:hypothetical protein